MFWKRISWSQVARICFSALALVMLFVNYRATQKDPVASAQVLFNNPTHGATGATGAQGTAGTNASNYGIRVQTDATGLYVWTFPTGCQHSGNIPYFSAVAEGPTPQAGVTVNPQVEGVPTATTVSFRVTRTTAATVALIGLTILSLTASSATYLDLSCSPQ